jgi:signal transduction histidine kinase
MLAITSYELGREYILSRRARLQLGQLRGELAQLERVNTLGRLASGLAHELTQPLSAVGLNIDTALRRLESKNPDLEELREVVGDIQRDTRRLVDVIEHMRALFKRGTLEVQPLALDGVVRDALALVRPEAVSRNVVVECNVQPGLPRVSGDRVHISQVLLNLVLNAIDAVQSRPKDRRHVVIEAQVASTGGIEIAVKDTGIGIPDDKLEEVFDPLFTTKPGSLGMGLALSRTIVDAHGGRLWAKNGLDGSDAAFFFTLPLA